MYAIGELARAAGVSVRMLRHYDEIGLLKPARVDSTSGYRFYESGQLARLRRVLALKDLGFTLAQVGRIVDEDVGADELRGMLRLRRIELAGEISHAQDRLRRVEQQIRSIDREKTMTAIEIACKRVESMLVAAVSARAESWAPSDIGPVIKPLYPRLFKRIEAGGLTTVGVPIAYYESDGDGIAVHAAIGIEGVVRDVDGLHLVELPAIEEAVTAVHRGSMEDCETTVEPMLHWMEANGYRWLGYSREVYLHCPDDEAEWLTEMQFAVTST